MSVTEKLGGIERLVEIMATLRSPDGCPWDAEQTPESLKPYVVEECYEVLAAIDAGSPREICEELGDLLLQVVFLARIFEERGSFGIEDVASAIADKLVRRHPHVFADAENGDPCSLDLQWERIKAKEQVSRGKAESVVAGVPQNLPALLLARKLQEKSGRYRLALPAGDSRLESRLSSLEKFLDRNDRQEAERAYGDLLFDLVRMGDAMDLDAEDALRMSCARFRKKLMELENALASIGKTIRETPPDELAPLWEKVLASKDR